jgi:CMP-N-acetylneuraminic acid synthetase
MSNILITLCARGGSKGVPNKNIKKLCGKPLIQYSIEIANEFSNTVADKCKIALSTDDEKILTVTRQCGLDTDYIRPEELATDTSGKVDVINHLVVYEEQLIGEKYDLVIDLDVSSPLRNKMDLIRAMDIIVNDPETYNLFSVSDAHRNPYFNMVELGEDGYFKLIKQLPFNVFSRQTAPLVYDLNASFYFYKRIFFEQNFKTVITPKTQIFKVEHICFDIDSILDFEIMEFLISKNKLDFDL